VHVDGSVKRTVTNYGLADYELFMNSGLYDDLVSSSMLVPHIEEDVPHDWNISKLLAPERIPFISYPYEWSFGQLRDAALLTLDIQEMALRRGMSLKDASAFNVQFRGSEPVFIDTLSFEPNEPGPWVAYSQFCRHFLAPLLLMSHVAANFNTTFRTSLDGFPLDLTARLLPWKAFLRFGNLLHIFMHSRAQQKYQACDAQISRTAAAETDRKLSLVESLRSCTEAIRPSHDETEWVNYYEKNASHYSISAEESKESAVVRALTIIRPRLVFDLGGNLGTYSRLATDRGAYCVSCDIDPLCVHRNYEAARTERNRLLLPLMLNLTNPTPALGFALSERSSFFERGEADLVMALALLHHLRISGNIPMANIAAQAAQLGRNLLIEYVPKSDAMAQALLRSRRDTFHDYDDTGFRDAFGAYFDLEATFPVAETQRTLYLFKRRSKQWRTSVI
jgi:hypothetical protein